MTNIEKTILIDRYLSHEMSPKERQDFEKLLSEPDSSYNDETSFQNEMTLQKEIEDSVRERGLREMLKKEETQICSKQRIKHIALWSLGSGSVIAAIAAIMLLLLVVAPVAHMMKDYSNNYITQVEISSIRGGDEYSEMLNNALLLMQNNEWHKASAIIEEVIHTTAYSQDEQIREIYYNAEWLKTICLMHDGKVLKAKRLLRKITNSESPYKDKALEILEQTE